MADVVLEQVTKRYDDGHEAVVGLELEVADGEFLVLVGPSGCGKTTTLRMIAGLDTVTSGRVRIGGVDVTSLPPRDRDVAMVFQSFALYPHMTVAENMGFALRLAKVDRREIDARVAAAAEVLGLRDHLGRKPAALSGGQRQRVAMGRAMVRQPQVFLMDEPLSNLDAKLRLQMRGEVTALAHRLATTTIYVTHDQVEAMTMGDRVAVLNEGTLQQVDSPQHLYSRPATLFVAGFIGAPSINLVPARRDGRDVVLGVRPEHLAVAAGGLDEAPGDGWIAARVTRVEMLGPEMLVHVQTVAGKAPAQELIARRAPVDPPEVGSEAAVRFDERGALCFDAASGLALPS